MVDVQSYRVFDRFGAGSGGGGMIICVGCKRALNNRFNAVGQIRPILAISDQWDSGLFSDQLRNVQ